MVQRIGIESKRAFHNQRGLGNYNRNLIELLTRFAPQYEYYLFAQPTPNYSFPNTTIVPSYGIPALWRSYGCLQDIRSHQIGLFIGPSGELPYGIEKIPHLKKVVVIQDLICYRFPQLYSWGYRHLFISKMRYACKVADIIIAISEQTKRDIIHYYGTSADKIQVLYQNCHPQFRTPISDETIQDVKNKMNLPDDYVLIIGAIEARKNILRLIEAMAIAKVERPLVVIGNGTRQYIEKVVTLADKLGVDLRLYTHTDFKDFPTIYKGATVFVYPSLFEGFGAPILEAMCVGVPVITSQGGCFEEVGGRAVKYIDPLDVTSLVHTLQLVISDKVLQKQMVLSGYEQVQKFTDEVVAKNLLRILKLRGE